MASSNIKLFDENKGNMLSDSEFIISNQRMNGLQTGVASSQLQNKAMYQASLVAYAIAQVMMQNGLNANDTDAVSAFVANLSGTMLQKVYDIATTAEAQAGVATGKWMSPALVKAAIDYKFKNAVTFGNTVTLAKDPTQNLQAATKQYVDNIFNNFIWQVKTNFGYVEKESEGIQSYTGNASSITVYTRLDIDQSTGKITLIGSKIVNANSLNPNAIGTYSMYDNKVTKCKSATNMSSGFWKINYTTITSVENYFSIVYKIGKSENDYPEGLSGSDYYTKLGKIGDILAA